MTAPGLSLTGRIDLAGAKLSRTDARDWLARAAVWFETVGDTVLDAQLGRDADDRPVLYATVHPAADDVEVRLSCDGTVRLTADTFAAGPGYHAHLAGLASALADDFDLTWTHADDPTGFVLRPDMAALERKFLECLGRKCRGLSEAASEWAGEPIPLGLPDDHGFTHPGPVLTPTGPRTRAWLAAAAADPKAGRDFFPWWTPDLDAAFYRNRAAVLLWCEYPWRPPLTDDEAELTDQAAGDLATAFGMDPSGPLPWREWAEVMAAIDADDHRLTVEPIDPAVKEAVLKRAAAVPADAPRVGYRRLPVRIPVGGGWTVEVPGSFADGWCEDGRTWTGWDAGRRVSVRVGGPVPAGFAACGDRVWVRVEGGDAAWADAVRQSLRCDVAAAH